MATERGALVTHFEDPRALVFGDRRRNTLLAVALALVLAALSAAVDYLALQAVVNGQTDLRLAVELAAVFAMRTPVGYLLVVAIAAGHAAGNRGYLPTVLLASALRAGDAVFYVADMRVLLESAVELGGATIAVGFRPYFLADHPPEVLVYSTVGFALGLLVRRRLRNGANA
ncbi:hypothetical protein ACFQMA_06785 [Halosimplex aquaticum]|uniref:Uncharacterized protein n=1 Tax=Halosimplex aquaticum TaxID=3026162 RepID=A0ABD5Y136_9EURY|nr:hypothetical protein [Halosimplex aquaticum]